MDDQPDKNDRPEMVEPKRKKVQVRLWIAALISFAIAIVAYIETHMIAIFAVCSPFIYVAYFYSHGQDRNRPKGKALKDKLN